MWLDWILIPTFYRLAGSDANLPKKRLLRIVGIPLYIFLRFPTVEQAILSILFGVVLSLDLDAIEWRNWGYVFSRGLGMALCLYPIAGYWTISLALFRTFLLYWSVIGIFLLKIDHRWTEILTGVAIAGLLQL